MDVSLWISRALLSALLLGSLAFSGCGNRFDLSTERGRRARIDEANFHLSQGQCGAALEAIDHLYNSPQVDDEVRIIKASAHACAGTFNLLTLVANMSGATNYFSALAKSLTNSAGDGAPSSFYQAVDVLTRSGSLMNAVNRTQDVNDYMVFLQMGVIGSILRNYGSPASDGSQGAALVYETAGADPAGEMSNEDACALTAAFAHFSDSLNYSSISDSDTTALKSSLESVCTAAGLGSCANANKDRSLCDGNNNAVSNTAAGVVTSVDTSW